MSIEDKHLKQAEISEFEHENLINVLRQIKRWDADQFVKNNKFSLPLNVRKQIQSAIGKG